MLICPNFINAIQTIISQMAKCSQAYRKLYSADLFSQIWQFIVRALICSALWR